MNAEIAMARIGELLTDYTEGDTRPLATLLQIARVVGNFESGRQ